MARQNIDTGALGNPATGDTLRTAMTKANQNFTELYEDLAGTSSSGGFLTNPTTNGDVKIQANGTGIVEIDRLSINNTTITSMDTNADVTIHGNGTGGVVLGGQVTAGAISTNEITNRGSNSNITIEPQGTGDILLKCGGQVGIGDVGSPDSSLHIKQTNAIITLQRTNDNNTPGIDFQSNGGNVRAQIYMDGMNGVNKELIFKVRDDSSTDERFRVTKSGANVTGTFNIMDDSDSTLSDATISMAENKITTLRSNDNLELNANGTGTVKTDSNLHLLSATPIIQIQRSDNANVPGISFLGDGGTEGGSIKFDGTSGTTNEIILSSFHSSAVTERLRVQTTGAKVTGILKIPDGSSSDNYAGFGDADDLKIFHNGSHSIIRETGSGSLYLQSDNNVILGKDTSGEFFVRGIADGAVELYHDNSKKFETTSGGVSVTGNLDADGTQIDFTNLPTSDPAVAGRLWRSGNDVKISTG